MKFTRRSAATNLLGMTALGTLLSAPLAAADKAAKSSGTRHCFAVYYPWKEDAKFDYDYYRNTHLKMLAELYGKSIGTMRARKGLRRGDGSAPAFVTALTVEILSMEAFNAAAKEHRPRLIADLANFTNITPIAQIEEVLD